jgi:hypothetical protein
MSLPGDLTLNMLHGVYLKNRGVNWDDIKDYYSDQGEFGNYLIESLRPGYFGNYGNEDPEAMWKICLVLVKQNHGIKAVEGIANLEDAILEKAAKKRKGFGT